MGPAAGAWGGGIGAGGAASSTGGQGGGFMGAGGSSGSGGPYGNWFGLGNRPGGLWGGANLYESRGRRATTKKQRKAQMASNIFDPLGLFSGVFMGLAGDDDEMEEYYKKGIDAAIEAQKRYEERVDEAINKAEQYQGLSMRFLRDAEEGKYSLFRGLGSGASGWRDYVAGGMGEAGVGDYAPSGYRGFIKGAKKKGLKKGIIRKRGNKGVTVKSIDPEMWAEDVLKSPQGMMVDMLTEEAFQLLTRTGDLWEGMTSSIFGAATDQLAAASRNLGVVMRGMTAKGGDARNMAQGMALKLLNQVELNKIGAQTLREGMADLNYWARDNANARLAFNALWTQGIPLTNSGYTDAMANLMHLYSTNIFPAIVATAGTMYAGDMSTAAYNAAAQGARNPVSGTNWGSVITGLAGIAAGAGMAYLSGRQEKTEEGEELERPTYLGGSFAG